MNNEFNIKHHHRRPHLDTTAVENTYSSTAFDIAAEKPASSPCPHLNGPCARSLQPRDNTKHHCPHTQLLSLSETSLLPLTLTNTASAKKGLRASCRHTCRHERKSNFRLNDLGRGCSRRLGSRAYALQLQQGFWSIGICMGGFRGGGIWRDWRLQSDKHSTSIGTLACKSAMMIDDR